MIEVNNLCKSFEYHKKETGLKASFKNLFFREKLVKDAVKNISFQIEQGEFVGFLGPNGAGKTTTLKMLSGILYPTAGNAKVLGYTPWDRKKEFKKQFSIIMGQKNQLWLDLPANESLILNKYIYEVDEKVFNDSLEELSELLDVKHVLAVQVRRLSLGERMKLELIAALIHKPKVIFLDEPTIGLDIISQQKIRDFLSYYNEQQKATIILTSHYMKDIQDLCKRAVIINDGNLVFDGNVGDINDVFNYKKRIKLKFSEAVSENLLISLGDIKECTPFSAILEVDKDKLRDYSKIILDTLPIADLNIEDIPLEEGIARIFHQETVNNG